MLDEPVRPIPGDDADRVPEAGMGLCLSGGGYRAMVFHVGALWRLYDAGLLGRVQRISSVSGGSIAAANLALKWKLLPFDPASTQESVKLVVEPIRALASETIDAEAVGGYPF